MLGACLQNQSRPNCTIGGCESHLPHGVLEPPLNLAAAKSLERLAGMYSALYASEFGPQRMSMDLSGFELMLS